MESPSRQRGASRRKAQEQGPDATKAAKQKAQELGVDLSQVEGSGSEGRVTVKDVTSAAN
jgi:pyruvate/2-oxoglutarate dehydrogenase complex dihydrolipoamide acyltransferase (E2) component